MAIVDPSICVSGQISLHEAHRFLQIASPEPGLSGRAVRSGQLLGKISPISLVQESGVERSSSSALQLNHTQDKILFPTCSWLRSRFTCSDALSQAVTSYHKLSKTARSVAVTVGPVVHAEEFLLSGACCPFIEGILAGDPHIERIVRAIDGLACDLRKMDFVLLTGPACNACQYVCIHVRSADHRRSTKGASHMYCFFELLL